MKFGCRIRNLPRERRRTAARHAIAVDPGNLPAGLTIDQLDGDEGERLAIQVQKWWGPTVDLTVGFLDRPPRELRDKILIHLNAWARDADVRFHPSDVDPMVRIGRFTESERPGFGGYWSYVGTDVGLVTSADEPTMNLEGFTTATADSEFRRVVRHEAGHTLGFPHEHMRQELVDRLDPEKVIAAYTASEGWTVEEVWDQVLTPIEERSILGTRASDPTSIMCYQIEGALTTDGQPIPGGTDINELDHDFIARVYPRSGPEIDGTIRK